MVNIQTSQLSPTRVISWTQKSVLSIPLLALLLILKGEEFLRQQPRQSRIWRKWVSVLKVTQFTTHVSGAAAVPLPLGVFHNTHKHTRQPPELTGGRGKTEDETHWLSNPQSCILNLQIYE